MPLGIKIFVTLLAGFVGTVSAYKMLVPIDLRIAHERRLATGLEALRRMRSLELAQEDAARILRALNWVYGTPRAISFTAPDMWLWRCGFTSLIFAHIYVLIFDWIISAYVPHISIIVAIYLNGILDTISVNVSRALFGAMSKSTQIRLVVLMAFVDLIAGTLLYLSGPMWIAAYGVAFFSSDRHFFELLFELLGFWEFNSWKMFWAVTFGSTIIPTALHLLVTLFFFGSKVVAQPLRLALEKTLEYVNRLPNPVGVAGGLAAVAIIGLVWVMSVVT